MQIINLIIFVTFTLTITSSAPIGYKSKQFREMETKNIPIRKTFDKQDDITFDQMKPLVISKTIEHNTDNNEQFQNDATEKVYKTIGRNVAGKTATTQTDDLSEQWSNSNARKWFATLIVSNGSVKSAQHLRQATTPASQSTVVPNRCISSCALPSARPAAVVACKHDEKYTLTGQDDKILTSGAIPPAVLRNNYKNYVAISTFDDHGHIVRRIVQKDMIRVITTSTQNVLK